MQDDKEHFRISRGSEKSFGYTFAAVSFFFSGYSYLHFPTSKIWWIALIFACGFLLISVTRPKTFFLANIIWFKLGMLLGRFVAPLAMAIIFLFLVTPIGVCLKMLGKDFTGEKNKNSVSLWVDRSKHVTSMKDQF